jgi:hypothetical protein
MSPFLEINARFHEQRLTSHIVSCLNQNRNDNFLFRFDCQKRQNVKTAERTRLVSMVWK